MNIILKLLILLKNIVLTIVGCIGILLSFMCLQEELTLSIILLLLSFICFFCSKKMYINIIHKFTKHKSSSSIAKNVNTSAVYKEKLNTTINDTINSSNKNKIILKSKITPFSEVIENFALKWKYMDVIVAGTRYRNIDYSKLSLDKTIKFKKEPNNIYDNNAIQVFQGDLFLGYMPKGTLQNMLNKYLDNENYFVFSKLNLIDETNQKLQIQIAFYKEIKDSDYKSYQRIDTDLIKTSKKDSISLSSRQDFLCFLEKGPFINIEEQYDATCLLVSNSLGNEIGELNESISNKVKEYINNPQYIVLTEVIDVTESDLGKYGAKIAIHIYEK